MKFVSISVSDGVATVSLHRGKVNAFTEEVVAELRESLRELGTETDVRALIVTGRGKFFSFGFDVPYFMNHTRDAFTAFLKGFAALYTDLFLFPKPVVAALNGHTVAGGCMLATACDRRLMVRGKAKISLNEVTFGSSVLAGSVEMLKACVGDRNAQTILCTGAMFSAEEAYQMGLVDEVTSEEDLLEKARIAAKDLARGDAQAFATIKKLLRQSRAETMKQKEEPSIHEFVEIWYSPSTREQIRNIVIRD
jgi:3,2-trans-enoyl-CoA isomerase